jgi:hypothetical protein
MKKFLLTSVLFALLVSAVACGEIASSTPGSSETAASTASPKQTVATSQSTSATTAPAVCRHVFGDWVTLKESLCNSHGQMARYCEKCGAPDKILTVPLAAHNYVSETIPPTKTEDGYTKFTCSVCGESYIKDTVPALGSQGLAFSPLEDPSYDKPYCRITGIGTCTDTDIVIPSNIDGYEVLAIGIRAFQDQTQITSITIPDTVTSFNDRAFQGCTGLKEFTFPRRTMWAGDYLFIGCDNLETINFRFSTAVSYISPQMLHGASAFKTATFDSHCLNEEICQGNKQVETVIIKENVRIIESDAFDFCENLKTVIFEEGEKWLTVKNAFELCKNIESITYSSAIGSINELAFCDSYSLSYIILSKDIKPFSKNLFKNLPLKSVYYMGNEADWEKIKEIEENPTIAAAKLYYYSEEPITDGKHWHYTDGKPTIWE